MPLIKFSTYAALADAVRGARSECLDALRKDPDTRSSWLVSRGAWIRTIGLDGDASNGDGEWEFKPTKACYDRLIGLRDDPAVTAVYIEGGHNAAETGADYAAGSYDPWVGEWTVTVWNRGS
jgi:hypothetical protein